MTFLCRACTALILGHAIACSDDSHSKVNTDDDPSTEQDAAPGEPRPEDAGTALPDAALPALPDAFALANGCYTLENGDGKRLIAASDTTFAFASSDADEAARLFLKPSDLGTYLFYDRFGHYVVAEDGPLLRQAALLSDILTLNDQYVSGAEWQVVPIGHGAERFRVRHLKTQRWLGLAGLTTASDAVELSFEPSTGCAEHPELTLDAEGRVERTTFEDGSLYGIVDTHSHILTNFGFGGGGLFHGAPFHRLGVAHALSDCAMFHGSMGRKDFFGYGYRDHGNPDVLSLLPALVSGELGSDDHHTEGYPFFTDWPSATSPTHQTQYYRWLERAWLAGLRLVVQMATSNQIICDFMVGQGYQSVRYSCNDMVAVDRQVTEAHNLERYIDAQAGGPGKGFFRIVETPAEARAAIRAGKLAVVLGIETSNLFDCFSTPHSGAPNCDPEYVKAQLDAYHERGVRSVFPVHKYDNGFSPGDGNRGFIELGNFLNSGQWSSYVLDCPTDAHANFDHGDVQLGGLNQPRDRYDTPPPNDTSGFAERPMVTVTPYTLRLTQGSLSGPYCQKFGMTELGELLLREMMKRGMLVEIDHLPQRSRVRALELLEDSDYPPMATHGNTSGGRVYALGGASCTWLGSCRDPKRKGAMLDSLRGHLAEMEAVGAYPAEGFGFDLNGLSSYRKGRFGERANCAAPQEDPITYPFSSFAGDVRFTEPRIGTRVIDFNTEGLAHVGLLPELLEDARRDAERDEDLLPLFHSAEGYIRAWEKAEQRGRELSAAP